MTLCLSPDQFQAQIYSLSGKLKIIFSLLLLHESEGELLGWTCPRKTFHRWDNRTVSPPCGFACVLLTAMGGRISFHIGDKGGLSRGFEGASNRQASKRKPGRQKS